MTEHLLRPIRAVLFDLDDTLYDRAGAFRRWAETYLREQCGMTDESERQAMLAQIAALDADGYGSKKAVLEALCRLTSPKPGTPDAGADAFYEQFLSQLTLDSEAVELLMVVEDQGLPWGIITNGTARQWRKLEQLGLRHRTPCLFVSETFGCAKPDPAIFQAAAECLGVPPPEILFVGDHPLNDILGAARAGLQTAWLHRGRSWPEEHPVTECLRLSCLTELRARLEN